KDMNSTDIHVIFLYEYKLGNNAAKAARNINQAFGENTVNDRKVQRWFEKFRSDDFSLQNERRRPKTSVKNSSIWLREMAIWIRLAFKLLDLLSSSSSRNEEELFLKDNP
ncbi:SETMR methyltransferase, partial [Acromyrmex insinuator]